MNAKSMNLSCAVGAALAVAFAAVPLAARAQAAMQHDMPGMPAMNMQDAPAKQEMAPPAQNGGAPAMRMDAQPNGEHGGMQRNGANGANGASAWEMPAKPMSAGKQPMQQDMQMGPMLGGSPPPDARDPDAYAEGRKKHLLPGMDMADNDLYSNVMINELEYADGRYGNGQYLDAEAWYGGDHHKLWLKAEAERRDGKLESSRTEALWDRVFAPYWSTQLGMRHDTGSGKSRDWLAFGVQGLSPYWFETTATAYAASGGMLAVRGEARYDVLFTQRLILEPKVEANLYSKDDAERGIGSGLSDISVGLRLRYEIRRQFAPYIGVTWRNKYGNTADMARAAGEPVHEFAAVAGLRMWF